MLQLYDLTVCYLVWSEIDVRISIFLMFSFAITDLNCASELLIKLFIWCCFVDAAEICFYGSNFQGIYPVGVQAEDDSRYHLKVER